MNTLAGNLAQPVTTVPPALGAVYELFLSGAEQVRSRSEEELTPDACLNIFSSNPSGDRSQSKSFSVAVTQGHEQPPL